MISIGIIIGLIYMDWIVKSCLCLLVTTCIFIIIAVATPGWVIMKFEIGAQGPVDDDPFATGKPKVLRIEVDYSLLYIVSCVASLCKSKTIDELSDSIYGQPWTSTLSNSIYATGLDVLETYRDEGIAAIVTSIISLLLTFVYVRRLKYGSRIPGIIAWISIAISGILAALLVDHYRNFNRRIILLESVLHNLELGTSYSVILIGFACALAFLALIPLAVTLKNNTPQTSGQVINVVRYDGAQFPIVQLGGTMATMQGYSELQEDQGTPYSQAGFKQNIKNNV